MSLISHRLMAITSLARLGNGHPATTMDMQQTFLSKDALIRTSIVGDAVVGYANRNDYRREINGTYPTINLLSDGNIGNLLTAHSTSTINVHGGTVGNNLDAYNSSRINLTGGTICNALTAFNQSIVNFSGGTIGNALAALGSSTINITGGNTRLVYAASDSIVNISGGNIGMEVIATGNSVIQFIGSDLEARLVDAKYLSLFSKFILSGKLEDGTEIADRPLYIQNGSCARFTLHNASYLP